MDGLFDPETSRRVLTTSWNELVVPQLAVISDSDETANDILARILRLQPEITVNKALKLLSLTLSGRSPGGLSELKSLVFSRMDVRSWYRLYREIKEVNRLLDTVTEETWWSQVNTQLAEYRLLTFIRN